MKISFLIPCFNEEDNVIPMSKAITEQVKSLSKPYDYEIIFIDNYSQDKTRENLEKICSEDKHIKAIFNARNYGQFNSPFYGLQQTTGDCTITLCCDFQDPPEMIPDLVREWEKGAKVVCAVKTQSKENRFIRSLRSIYYKLLKKYSDFRQIEHFTGTGLYDKTFIDVLKSLDEPSPFIRSLVAELGFKMVEVPYTQQKRRMGKTHNNVKTLYDATMLSVTSYMKMPIRFMMVFAIIMSFVGFAGGITSIVLHCLKVHNMMFYGLLSALLLISGIGFAFLSVLGEYIVNVKTKVTKRPLVIEEKRINF